MNSYELALLFLPAYTYAGGLAWARVHRRDHDRDRCFEQSPLCVLSGMLWPVTIIVAILAVCIRAGIRTEKRLFNIFNVNITVSQEEAIRKAEEELKQINDKLKDI